MHALLPHPSRGSVCSGTRHGLTHAFRSPCFRQQCEEASYHSHSSRGKPIGTRAVCRRKGRILSPVLTQSHSSPPGPVSSESTRASSTSPSSSPSSSHRPDLHVVLVHPQIPQNAGNVARTCAATSVALHLVGPLGFEIDDKKLKRAGLDYWPHVCVKVHDSWQAFWQFFSDLQGPKRLVGFSVYGSSYYAGPEFTYQTGDWLLFGAETTGLPPEAHDHIRSSGGSLVKIPICQDHVRSINLAVSVGVGLFEALRQLDEGQHQVEPRDDSRLRLPTPFVLQRQEGAVAGDGAVQPAAAAE